MTIKRGSTGDDVKALQAALRSKGYSVSIDGAYGPQTEAAVMAFQRDHGLSIDGIVGPMTWEAVLGPPRPMSRPPYPSDRCFPLRCLRDGRKPVVTSGHRDSNPSRPNHYGCDLFYAYKEGIDPPKKIGDSGRTKKWWLPEETYAVAPFEGRVVLAGWSATGFRVWLEHDTGWKAGFFHLDKLGVTVGARIGKGESIGRCNDNPVDKGDADHLHFELYWGDIVSDAAHGHYPRGTVDPEPMLSNTPYLPAL